MPIADFDFVSPPDLVGVTTSFFGGEIDLDPASSDEANTLINANRYFTPRSNGLAQSWKAKNIYLYPPRELMSYDEQPKTRHVFKKPKRFIKSAQRVWLEECYKRYLKREFDEAVVLLTSSEVALITTQKLGIDFPLCIMKTRPDLFLDTPGLPKLTNTRCFGFIYYFPSLHNTSKRVLEFSETYSSLGRVYY